MGPGDITYPEHITVGLGKYLQSAMNQQPDFSGINQMFANMGTTGPFVRGGTFYNPEQAKELATPSYLAARGNIAQNDISNMFNLANLAMGTGTARGNIAAMMPALQAAQIRANMAGTSSLFGGLF